MQHATATLHTDVDPVMEVHHYWTSTRDGHPEHMAHVTLGIEQLDGTLDTVEISIPVCEFTVSAVAA